MTLNEHKLKSNFTESSIHHQRKANGKDLFDVAFKINSLITVRSSDWCSRVVIVEIELMAIHWDLIKNQMTL